jgi:conjugal transfer pilin signal peptidase TrbI
MMVDPATLGPCTPDGKVLRRLRRSFGNALRQARNHWVLYTVVFAIWGLAFVRVFVDPTPHLPLLFN